MISTRKISLFIAVFIITGGFVFGQKAIDKSRLNVGQGVKKANFTTQGIGLLKNNLPKQLSINTKPSYTQFYRDLLISSSQNNANNNSDKAVDKINKTEKIQISSIYPNPANDYAVIDYDVLSNYNNANVTFYNLIGKEIADFELNPSQDKLRVNTSNWESGIYMYQLVVDDKKISTKKLIVRHN